MSVLLSYPKFEEGNFAFGGVNAIGWRGQAEPYGGGEKPLVIRGIPRIVALLLFIVVDFFNLN